MGRPFSIYLAAAAVIAAAVVAAAAAVPVAAIVAAAAEQQNQDDDPPPVVITAEIVAHSRYLQDFIERFAAHSMLFRSPENVRLWECVIFSQSP